MKEETNPRGLPKRRKGASIPALVLKDRKLRRACVYWYLGTSVAKKAAEQTNRVLEENGKLPELMKKSVWLDEDREQVRALLLNANQAA